MPLDSHCLNSDSPFLTEPGFCLIESRALMAATSGCLDPKLCPCAGPLQPEIQPALEPGRGIVLGYQATDATACRHSQVIPPLHLPCQGPLRHDCLCQELHCVVRPLQVPRVAVDPPCGCILCVAKCNNERMYVRSPTWILFTWVPRSEAPPYMDTFYMSTSLRS